MKEIFNIKLSDEEFDYLMGEQLNGKQLKVVEGKVISVDKAITQEELNNAKILDLKKKLKETDYQAIKHFEGYLSDSEYEPIKMQRQAWRDEINRLEKEQ